MTPKGAASSTSSDRYKRDRIRPRALRVYSTVRKEGKLFYIGVVASLLLQCSEELGVLQEDTLLCVIAWNSEYVVRRILLYRRTQKDRQKDLVLSRDTLCPTIPGYRVRTYEYCQSQKKTEQLQTSTYLSILSPCSHYFFSFLRRRTTWRC